MEGFEAAERAAQKRRRLQDIAASTKPTQSKQEAFKDVKEKLRALAKLYQHDMGWVKHFLKWSGMVWPFAQMLPNYNIHLMRNGLTMSQLKLQVRDLHMGYHELGPVAGS